MKQLYYLPSVSNNLNAFCIVFVAVILIACSDMDDLHQKYLDRGEIIYAARIDSVLPHPGKNRIELELHIRSQRIKTARVYWNDHNDSLDFDIGGKGIFKIMLDNMEERSYIFNLIGIDEFGNKSLPVEASAYVYGEKYQAQISNRPVKSTKINAQGNVTIVWGVADGAYQSEVKYTDLDGNSKVQSFPANQTTSVISDFQPNTTYEYRTVFRPDTTGIDNFYTDYTPVTLFSIDQEDWTIINFSTNHGGSDNSVNNFIDGTAATRWHSQAGASSYPHHATIDMGAVRTITQFGLWISTFDTGPNGDNRAPDKVQFLVSLDNITWTDLGIYDFNRNLLGQQTIVMPPASQGRYFRFVGVQGPENNMVMGDISAYGF